MSKTIDDIRAQFDKRANCLRKAVLCKALSVDEAKLLMHKALEEIVEDKKDELLSDVSKRWQIRPGSELD